MPKLDDQISTLQERLNRLKLRQHHIDARKRAAELRRERKLQTRRNILLGAIVAAKVERGEIDRAQYVRWIEESVTRPDDRALFGLQGVPQVLQSEAGQREIETP